MTKKKIQVEKPGPALPRESCPRCAGAGTIGPDDSVDCPDCDGSGDRCPKCKMGFYNCTCEGG